MEPQERPAKMRKLASRPEEEPVGAMSDSDAASVRSEPQQKVPAESLSAGVTAAAAAVEDDSTAPKLSKNQLKKQRRLERWEAGREDRKVKRREKIKAKKERRREAWAQRKSNADDAMPPPSKSRAPRHSAGDGTQVPVTVVFDCAFEDLMFDNELKSLGLQLTRCYSDNRKSAFRPHLAISSFGGKLKERFDGILAKQYTSWKGVQFFQDDFVSVAGKSKDWMKSAGGGQITGALESAEGPEANNGASEDEGEVVYLSSESDVTLTRLKPYSTYVVGGIVDKNRHKGLCYKRAMKRGMKTAKLPIGEFLHMNSRQVLATNHVLEIMLKWMESGDWGKAFMEVMPKRKGGVLREAGEEDDEQSEAEKCRDVSHE